MDTELDNLLFHPLFGGVSFHHPPIEGVVCGSTLSTILFSIKGKFDEHLRVKASFPFIDIRMHITPPYDSIC